MGLPCKMRWHTGYFGAFVIPFSLQRWKIGDEKKKSFTIAQDPIVKPMVNWRLSLIFRPT